MSDDIKIATEDPPAQAAPAPYPGETAADALVREAYSLLWTDQLMGIHLLPSDHAWMDKARAYLESRREASACGLEITEIAVSLAGAGSPVKAYVRVVLNDALVLSQLRVVTGKKGPFVAFPTTYSKEKGMRRSIVYPIDRGLHEYLHREILREYEDARAKEGV